MKSKLKSRLFWTLAFSLSASFFSYVFLIQGTLYFSLSANTLHALIQRRENELSTLESRFYADNINPDLVRKLGFVDSPDPIFISLGGPAPLVGYAAQRAK